MGLRRLNNFELMTSNDSIVTVDRWNWPSHSEVRTTVRGNQIDYSVRVD